MKLIKKVIGVDISKDDFKIRFGTLDQNMDQRVSKAFTFTNNPSGFNQLLKTISKVHYFNSENPSSNEVPVWFVMEATGVYYENLAYFLEKNKFSVSVILPNKMKYFSKTVENKSKTDAIDAANQTMFGLEKPLRAWVAPTESLKELKELTREYLSIKESIIIQKNKLHAKTYSYQANKEIVKRLEQHKFFLIKQLKQVLDQIKKLIKANSELHAKIKTITTIKGVGLITVAIAIAETNGFDLITNKNQLASYAGYDIVLNESGKYKGKSTISKKGNSNLRRAFYMPALCAARFNDKLKAFYIRLCKTKANKKIALIAVARKLLLLVYFLWKKNECFIQGYPNIKNN